MRSLVSSLALLVAATIAPSVSSAQTARSSASLVPAAMIAGPVAAPSALKTAAAPVLPSSGSALAQARVGRAERLMLIGLAIVVVGAVVDGDAGTIVMLSGAGVGLYGLYLYLQ